MLTTPSATAPSSCRNSVFSPHAIADNAAPLIPFFHCCLRRHPPTPTPWPQHFCFSLGSSMLLEGENFCSHCSYKVQTHHFSGSMNAFHLLLSRISWVWLSSEMQVAFISGLFIAEETLLAPKWNLHRQTNILPSETFWK